MQHNRELARERHLRPLHAGAFGSKPPAWAADELALLFRALEQIGVSFVHSDTDRR